MSTSKAEQEYILLGCKDGIRNDGRGRNIKKIDCTVQNKNNFLFSGFCDFREISLENNIFPHTNGSSRIIISDSVHIVCSIKVRVFVQIHFFY
jgi:exosome complex RNA-binding protein Rrp42 (RNase PH superfamily)